MIFWVLSLGTNLLASTERFSWSISPQGGPLPPPVRVCTQCVHRYRGVDPECFIHRFMNLFNIQLLTNTKFLCISQLKLCLLSGKINLIMIFFAFSLICQVHVFCQYISVAVVFLLSLCRKRDNSGYTTCICYLPSNFILLFTLLLVLNSSCFGFFC